MDQSIDKDVSLSRRHRRIRQLIPEEGVRRSPRISRSGVRPYYGSSRGSRESSTVSDDDNSARKSTTSSRRSSRASEVMNESGQLIYEESETEQDVTITNTSTSLRSSLGWKSTLPRTPRTLSPVDSGVGSGPASSVDDRRISPQSDIPQHLYGLDEDEEVQVTQTTQYVYNKERILITPKISSSPVKPQSSLWTSFGQWLLRVFSVPYFALVSMVTFDVVILERLSSLLAICTNPLEKKKSWFGLVVLIVCLLVFTWFLTALVSPSQSAGVSSEDIQRLRVALGKDVEGAVGDMKGSLLGWLEGNMTEMKETIDILSQKVGKLEKAQSDTDVGLSVAKDAIDSMQGTLKDLEKKMKEADENVSEDLKNLMDQISNLTSQAISQQEQVEKELSKMQKSIDNKLARDDAAVVMQKLIEELLEDDSSVLGVWLKEKMLNTVANDDLEEFNRTLIEMIAKRAASAGGLTQEEVENMIQSSLDLYSADKVGMFDYALETAGGSIPRSKCSATFAPSSSSVQLFGYTLWHFSNSARTVIQAGVLPGQCWAFPGQEGYVVIKLATDIEVTHVTVEHIPKVLSPSGSIDSAPKYFGVLVSSTEEEARESIGNFTYSGDKAIQTFPVKYPEKAVRFVEFKFYSNHGMKDYTCVYRLRVHGKMFKAEQN